MLGIRDISNRIQIQKEKRELFLKFKEILEIKEKPLVSAYRQAGNAKSSTTLHTHAQALCVRVCVTAAKRRRTCMCKSGNRQIKKKYNNKLLLLRRERASARSEAR